MNATQARILEEVRRIMRVELGIEREVAPEDELARDLQLDSLAVLTLAVGLEDRFRVALDEQDAPALRTVWDLVELTAARLEAAGREEHAR